MPERPIEPLIDVKTTAEILGLHPNTVLKLLRACVLPGLRLGRYWRLRTIDLDTWLKAQTQHHAQSTAYPKLSSIDDETD